MANNINREGFKTFLEFGAPSFEGNIILDSGELSEYYYRFMRIPLAYGEHKVDVLYGQRFYGTWENKPVTFNQEIRFLCLVVDNAKPSMKHRTSKRFSAVLLLPRILS